MSQELKSGGMKLSYHLANPDSAVAEATDSDHIRVSMTIDIEQGAGEPDMKMLLELYLKKDGEFWVPVPAPQFRLQPEGPTL